MSTILKSTNLKTVTSLTDPTNLKITKELPVNEKGEILYNEKNKIVNESLNYQHGKTYKQISNVSWIIENEYFDILLKKVANSEYLCFSNTFKPYEPMPIKVFQNPMNQDKPTLHDETPLTRYKHSIFDTKFKKLAESPTFYNNLFKNYSNYYLSSLKTTVVSKILPYDNVTALNVLIKQFGYVPTNSLLLTAIRNSRFKIANYLYENHKSVSFDYVQFFINGDAKSNLLVSKPSTSDNNSTVPIFSDFRHFFKQPLSTLYEICKWIIRFSSKLQPFINHMNKLSIVGTLKVKCCELNYKVANLLKYFKYFNGKFELLSNVQLKEMKFTNEELKQSIESFNTSDERVESLIRMVLPFNGLYGYSESFTFYQYKYSKINMASKLVNKDVDPFEFGVSDFDDYKCRKMLSTSLFNCIPNDSLRQIEFLNQTVNELKISESNYPNRKLNSINLFKVVVGYNDLEYIKLVHTNLFIANQLPILSDIIDYIKSNNVLDYILQFITTEFIMENKEFNFIKKLVTSSGGSTLELLVNLKNNHLDIYNQFYQHLKFGEDVSVTFESFKYLYENYKEFKTVYFDHLTSWPINNLYGLDQLDYVLFSTPLIKMDITHFEYINGIDSFDNLLDWVMKFNESVATSGKEQKKFDFGYNKDKLLSKYQVLKKPIKELLHINNNNNNNNALPLNLSQDIFKGILRYGDLNSLDYIMSNFFSTPSLVGSTRPNYLLNQLITNCIFEGQFEIIKFLDSNYPWVFKLDTPDQTNYKEQSILSGFPLILVFQNIFKCGNIELLLFFTQHLQLQIDEKIKQQDVFKENDDLLLSFFKKNKIMF